MVKRKHRAHSENSLKVKSEKGKEQRHAMKRYNAEKEFIMQMATGEGEILHKMQL